MFFRKGFLFFSRRQRVVFLFQEAKNNFFSFQEAKNSFSFLFQEAKEPDAGDDGYLSSSRAAVLADAEALLTCYGVGEESGAELLHAVVELCFTSSVRFLQPGLLLKVGFTQICHLHLAILLINVMFACLLI